MKTVISYSGTELTLEGELTVSEARDKLRIIGAMGSGSEIDVDEYFEEDTKYITFKKHVGEKG